MRLTTHRLLSPRFRAALEQVAQLIGSPVATRRDLIRLLQPSGYAHMSTLLEYKLAEGTRNTRTYSDARTMADQRKRMIWATNCLRKL